MTLKLRSDLPIKYYLNVYNEEDLQDNLVVLFNLIQYLSKVIQTKGKDHTLENYRFTSNSLKYVFGEKLKDETFKLALVKKIKSLITDEYLAVEKENMKITNKGITAFYTIE